MSDTIEPASRHREHAFNYLPINKKWTPCSFNCKTPILKRQEYGNKGMVNFFGSEPTKEIHLSICSSKQVFGICNFLVLRKTVNSFVKV